MKKIRFVFLFVAALLVIASCTDGFLDVNEDEDNPTTPTIPLVLTNAQNSMMFAFVEGQGLNDVVGQFTHYYSRRYAWTKYQPDGQTFGIRVSWATVYDALLDLQVVINQSKSAGNAKYAGIGMVCKAYLMSSAVDAWGDMPYTFAATVVDEDGNINLSTEALSPAFDDDEAIYSDVFALLDEAIDSLNSTSTDVLTPGEDDLIYSGNISQWLKAAYSIKLNMYNKVQNTSLYNQSDVDAIKDLVFTSVLDDFQYLFDGSSQNDQHYLLVQEYGGGQIDYQISPWLYEHMKGYTSGLLNGLEDPRIPYYFYNMLTPGEFPEAGVDPATGKVKVDYWDASTGFFGIRFASDGVDKDHAARGSATVAGVYPIGGFYDDGAGSTVGLSDDLGKAPFQFLTYHDILFIKAEMAQQGLITDQPASFYLNEALNAHFNKVNQVSDGADNGYPFLASGTFITDVMNVYNGGTAADQLELIITQKWIANFGGNLVESYNDKRRTGYPIYPNPNGPQEYNVLDYGPDADGFFWNAPSSDTNISTSNTFMLSMPWSTNELDRNLNAPDQKDIYTYSVFWDI